MKQERKRQIEQVAETIRDALQLNNEKVDLDEVITAGLGGEIIKFNDRNKHEEVIKLGEESFLIEINGTHSMTRQRISIAHEIGHLFLHMRYLTDEWGSIESGHSYDKAIGSRTQLEQEANVFAAAFLMPEDGFKTVAEQTSDENDYYDFDQIARYYDVSIDAVIYRGKNIGLWK